MNDDGPDQELGRWFADLRRADRHATLAFEPVWAGTLARAGGASPRPALRWAAAVALTLSAAALATALLRHRAPPAVDVATALVAWRSPTAFLLHGPGDDLLRTVPTVSASLLRLDALLPSPESIP